MSCERLRINSKSSHLAPNGGLLGADGLINDSYGQLEGVSSEHDLLFRLARDAIADAGSPDVSKSCGIVSGCLSFPRDGMQQVLAGVYEQHTERELGGFESMQNGCKTPSLLARPITEKDLADHAEHTRNKLHRPLHFAQSASVPLHFMWALPCSA